MSISVQTRDFLPYVTIGQYNSYPITIAFICSPVNLLGIATATATVNSHAVGLELENNIFSTADACLLEAIAHHSALATVHTRAGPGPGSGSGFGVGFRFGCFAGSLGILGGPDPGLLDM